MKCSAYIHGLITEEKPNIICCLQGEVETTIARIARKEVHRHRWFEGEKGRKLSWEEAKEEWLDKYYEDFYNYLSNTRWGRERFQENLIMMTHKELSHEDNLYVWTEIYKTFQYWSTKLAAFLKNRRSESTNNLENKI